MITNEKTLSVPETARLCDVSRGTINYWIKAKKLYAKRSGRNYSIAVFELIRFLKSTGKNIPAELINHDFQGPLFRSSQPCWEYWDGKNHSQACKDCVVFVNKLDNCFIAKKSSGIQCNTTCSDCQYYREIYLPRIQFIHQNQMPAAIYKDLYLWGGNGKFSQLVEFQEKDLIGMGVEVLVHPESLPTVISNIKNRALGDPQVPRQYNIFFNSNKHKKLSVEITVYPLAQPSGTHLILAEQLSN